MRRAQRIVNRNRSRVGSADASTGIEIGSQLKLGACTRGIDLSLIDVQRRQRSPRRNAALHRGISHHLIAILSRKVSAGAHREVPRTGIVCRPILLHHKEAIAHDGHIGGYAGRFNAARDLIGYRRIDGCAGADLHRIACPVGAHRLVEEIGKLRVAAPVANGVEIGKIIGNGRHRRRAGGQPGQGYGKLRHFSLLRTK